MWNEGERGDVDWNLRAAHVCKKSCAGLCQRCGHIAHRDRVAGRGTEAAGCDFADLVAGIIRQHRTSAHRLSAFGLEADAFALRAFFDDGAQRLGADENSGGAQVLRDRPEQARASRIDAGSEVLSVQAQPGLQPEAVAGGEAGPLNALVLQKSCQHFPRVRFGQGDLETVLARIAGPAHEPALAWLDAVHECESAGFDACRLQRGLCFRSLDGEDNAVERYDAGLEIAGHVHHMGLLVCIDAGIDAYQETYYVAA